MAGRGRISKSMKHKRHKDFFGRAFLLMGAVLTLVLPAAAADSAALLQGVHRVVVLGDSITYSGEYVDFIDAYFATRFSDRSIEVLNLGLPSETVSGLSEEGHAGGQFPRPDLKERVARVLEKTKPDLVIGFGFCILIF